MTRKSMEHVIPKYLNNEASDAEMNDLLLWLEDEDNLKIFKDYLAANHEINKSLLFDSIKAYESTLKTSIAVKAIPFYKNNIFKYAVAASVILLISLTFIFNKNDVEVITPVLVNNNIKTGTDKATLTLANGSNIILEKGKTYDTDYLNSNGEKLVYDKKNNSKQEIEYNYLTIPRGGQFFIELSDGTQVWLNSESQLKYPVNFVEGKSRQVELVYGEAYFDVSPSIEHKGAKFIVFNQSQEVEVLGTEFNIKAYKDESIIYTTLVEGKVTIGNGDISHNLIPDHQSILNVETNEIKITTVDVKSETSWKKGVFSFKGKPLKDIMKVISRWYDIDVVFVNKDLELVKFNGNLNKNQSIERVLSIMMSSKLNKYEIKNKTILLK